MANNTYTADYVRSVINKKREEKMDTSQPSHVFTAEYVRNVIDGKKQTEPLVKKGTPSSAGTKKATQTSQDLRPGLNDGALRRITNENKAKTQNRLETPYTKAERLGAEVLYTPEGLPYLSKKDVAKAEAKNVVVDANKFLADGYKMSDAEKIAAKEYAQKYLDEYNKGMRNRTISSDQQIADMSNPDSQYMKMSRLLNKTKTGSAIGAGIVDSTMRGLDALGISDLMEKAERKITGNDNTVIETLKDFTSDSEDQNKLAYGAGYMATEALKSSAVADALGKTKAFSALQGKAKTPLGKSTINVLGDLGVDTLLETAPNAIRDVREGKSAEEVAKNAAKNIGMNAAFNVLGEGIQTGLDGLNKNALKEKIPELKSEIEFAEERKQSLIKSAKEKVSSFFDNVMSNKGHSTEKYNQLKIGKVPADVAEKVKQASGGTLDISDKEFAIEGSKLYHEMIKHGNEKIELSRGQLPLTKADIEKTVDVMMSPDIVENLSTGLASEQRNTFAMAKLDEGYIVLVEAVGGKRNPTIVPEQILHVGRDKMERYIKEGKSMADMIYENSERKGTLEDNLLDIKNRVTAAQLANNAPAHTSETSQRSPLNRDAADRMNGLERPKPNEGYALANDISNDIVPTNPENVNVTSDDFLDEIAESTQKAKNIPKTRIEKDSKLSKMDKDISNLVKWYGDETAVSDLEELRTAMIDFESTGSMDALNRIGELTARLDDNFRGKTYTYQSKYKKNGALKSKGATYKYGDNVSVESILEDTLPVFDEIHQSKAASINMPQIVERVDNEIPYLRESAPADGKVREESHSMNIGKGRVNNVDEDVRNAFIDDPNLYTQLSNAETAAKAQQIYDSGNAQAEIYRMLDHKDPAAIPLGNKIVGDLIDEGRKDEAVELLRTMSTKLRESGQFSQAAAITMIKSDPETALRYVVRNIDDMNAAGKKKLGNKWKDFELTDAEMELFGNIKPGDAEAIKKAFESVGARLAKEYPVTTWEKIVELSKVGMLLNPRTNIRNIVSNWMLQPVRSLSDRVSALGQNAIHLINPDFKVTQSITGGGKEEKLLATEVWNSVKDSLLENTSRYEDVKGAVKDKQIFKGSVASKAFDRIFPGAIERANKAMGKNVDDSLLETARNFTYYLLEKGDEPFVKNNFVNRLASYMKAQGIKNIDEIPEDAIMLAKEEALKATFKDDNNFTNMLSSIKKNLGKGGEVIMPFTKTPANLAMRGIDYSPAGIVNSIKKLKNGSDVSKFMDDLSKNITGSAAIALGFYLTKNGIITGALSSDKDEAAFQKQQGKVAYSIKIGDNYYSYDWAQPAAIPIILGASIAQSIEESDNEEKTALEKIESVANIAQQATTSAADAWVELSPLQTISDIFNTSYGNSVPENVINEVLEFPQRFIPSSVGAAARTIDTTQRQTYSSGNPVRTQIDTAISKIPFLSKTLPAAYDTWGREVKRSDGTGEAAVAQMLSPGTLGNESATPIDGEIQRLYERTENAAVFPQKSKWTVDGNKLNNREYSNLQKEQGSLSYELAEELVNNSDYNKIDDSLKAKTLSELYSLTKALAENSVVGKAIPSSQEKIANIYKEYGPKVAVAYLQIGNMDGSGSDGALTKEDWKTYLRNSSLADFQKTYIYKTKYPKSKDNWYD